MKVCVHTCASRMFGYLRVEVSNAVVQRCLYLSRALAAADFACKILIVAVLHCTLAL